MSTKKKRQKPFSIGICAHNEEENIGYLLKSIFRQTIPDSFYLKEIIVVSSGSTDCTDAIVSKIAAKKPVIRLITEPTRTGKAKAVNTFIQQAKTKHLVLSSADVILGKGSLNIMLSELAKSHVGLTAPKIEPVNDNGDLVSFAFQLQWKLHHQINMQFPKSPKVGEVIAFKKIFKRILPTSAVDEANIEPLIHLQGYKVRYCPEATIYNKGPETLLEFLRQRRRIFAGHTALSKEHGYRVTTYSNTRILGTLIANMEWRTDYVFKVLLIMLLEAFARVVGLMDYTFRIRNHAVWKTTSTTKALKELYGK
jgi:cellulose synthase/poly-beta-1,6-N-acetylglucosamine synthase-like glycosyltransferase